MADQTLHLPRILCFHGGGSNAEIFTIQCRALIAQLRPHFRLCFVEAPFLSEPGPGMLPTFQDFGPFRRWLNWKADHDRVESEAVINEIDYSIRTAMDSDDKAGATGEWAGLLGFSQGAKICASLLYRQQIRAQRPGNEPDLRFRFAVLMAGRAPLVCLDSEITSPALAEASEYTSSPAFQNAQPPTDSLLRLPTLHVHGLRDPGLELHRQLLHLWCQEGTTRLVEWDGHHRLPIHSKDVSAVVDQIMALAKETGALETALLMQ